MELNKFGMTLDEAIEVIKEISPEDEQTSSGIAEARVLNAVHNGELMKRQEFQEVCDKIRDWMTAKIDPMHRKPEDISHKELYRSWVELWWWLDHYCEREPPTWGDEGGTSK